MPILIGLPVAMLFIVTLSYPWAALWTIIGIIVLFIAWSFYESIL